MVRVLQLDFILTHFVALLEHRPCFYLIDCLIVAFETIPQWGVGASVQSPLVFGMFGRIRIRNGLKSRIYIRNLSVDLLKVYNKFDASASVCAHPLNYMRPVGLARGILHDVWDEKSASFDENSLFGEAIGRFSDLDPYLMDPYSLSCWIRI